MQTIRVLFFCLLAMQLYAQADSTEKQYVFKWSDSAVKIYDLDASIKQAKYLEKCNCVPSQQVTIATLSQPIKNENGDFITKEVLYSLRFRCPNGEVYETCEWPLSLKSNDLKAKLKSDKYSWFYYCLATHYYADNSNAVFLTAEEWNTQPKRRADFLAQLIIKH